MEGGAYLLAFRFRFLGVVVVGVWLRFLETEVGCAGGGDRLVSDFSRFIVFVDVLVEGRRVWLWTGDVGASYWKRCREALNVVDVGVGVGAAASSITSFSC